MTDQLQLQVNDAVTVKISNNSGELEGVVAYLGRVEFTATGTGTGTGSTTDTDGGSSSANDDDCWVGVRLTGKCVGQGQNDGSVIAIGDSTGSGVGSSSCKRYFDCPANSGLFVRAASVTKRTLTKLEELRLRRELAASSTAAAAAAATAATTTHMSTTTTATSATISRANVSSSTVAGSAASASPSPSVLGSRTPPRFSETGVSATASATTTPSAATSITATGAKTKLEELRLRREALMAAKQESSAAAAASLTASASASGIQATTPPRAVASTLQRTSSPSPAASINITAAAAATTGTGQVVDELKRKLAEVTQQFRTKDDEVTSLLEKLAASEKESADQREKLAQLMTMQASLLAEAKKKETESKTAAPPQETPTKALLTQSVEAMTLEQNHLQSSHDALRDRLEDAVRDLASARNQLAREQQSRETALAELTRARAELTAHENQKHAAADQTDQRVSSDAAHYKERAKLQADLSALKRRVEQLEQGKMELEATIEDVTLDKEQLLEDKEALEDKYEEIKLDAETAQMEVEELRMELEDARATAERVTGIADALTVAAVATAGSAGVEQDQHGAAANLQQDAAADMVHALQVQNARLREALIRLREQSALEKMELTRQLRALEKEAEANTAVQTQVQVLTTTKQNLEEQINDLKDMVEQGAAFEIMVEDLSDRVMALEEDNVALSTVVREMEEAAELTAEMEEVQADELKAMAMDMEGRDTIIRNLEEAIKMQRRREDDFRRTVGNYKTTVDTLRHEKQALLELQQGGEGEKSSLVASSQKALSRAAQLVADAADMRKREAQAVMDGIDQVFYKHMSNRLESLLPHSVLSAELAAVKGELMASKVVSKASTSLAGIANSFRKTILPPLPSSVGGGASISGSLDLKLSDEVQQQVLTMIHQTEFAHVIAEVSSDLLRFLSAGQWPDLLPPEVSTELGAILGHAIPELDNMLGVILKTLKEEGALTVDQSNIGELRLTIQTTMQSLRTDIEREDGTVVPSTWNPPGLAILRDMTLAKFSCLGAASALSLAVDEHSGTFDSLRALDVLYNNVEKCSAQASNACLRLANLDPKSEKLVDELSGMCAGLATESKTLLTSVRGLLAASGDVSVCETSTENMLRGLAKLSLVLRAENLNPNENGSHHALSPETDDAWRGIASITRSIRAIDGDSEDINYLLRAHSIEHRLGDAVENEPKLAFAVTKVANLEKTLSSRMKEIAMQNARLSELEKLIAKSSSTPVGRGKNFDFRSSEEYNDLQEENRVLTEAMDVLQREVEMYENEIRALKDFKSPKRGAASNRTTPRRATTSISDFSPNPRGTVDDSQSTSALEATLFRPALQQALQEAARWKASATAAAIMNLPPLPISSIRSGDAFTSGNDVFSDDFIRLSSAIATFRIQKASVAMVDLTNSTKTPRAQLREMKARDAAASDGLETIVLRCRERIQ